MKSLIFLSILFFISSATAATLSEAWQLKRQQDNVWVWSIKGNSKIVGTMQRKRHAKKKDWSQIKKVEYFKSLETKKKKMLSLIGIKNWKANKQKWKKTKSGRELSIVGSYTNSKNEKVSFKELHVFQPTATYQILFTKPAGLKLSKNVVPNFFSAVKGMALSK